MPEAITQRFRKYRLCAWNSSHFQTACLLLHWCFQTILDSLDTLHLKDIKIWLLVCRWWWCVFVCGWVRGWVGEPESSRERASPHIILLSVHISCNIIIVRSSRYSPNEFWAAFDSYYRAYSNYFFYYFLSKVSADVVRCVDNIMDYGKYGGKQCVSRSTLFVKEASKTFQRMTKAFDFCCD